MALISLSWRPGGRRTVWLAVLAVAALLMMVVLWCIDLKLETPQCIHGICSFEFAGSMAKAQAIMASWGETKASEYAFLSLFMDYLFIVLYATTLALACVMLPVGFGGIWGSRIVRVGPYLAWAPMVAGFFDAMENASLILLLNGMTSDWLPPFAYFCALLKFGLIVLGAAYAVLCLVACAVLWIQSKAGRTVAEGEPLAKDLGEAAPPIRDRISEEWPDELRTIEQQAILLRRRFVSQEASEDSARGSELRVNLDAPREIAEPAKEGAVPSEMPGLPPFTLGVALSGGGIRSATLSLGFFQGLAKLGILPHLDYLSTVSGGGYFGSFLGQWFMNQGKYYQGTGSGGTYPRVRDGLADLDSKPVKCLRENGRYLAPVGSGDSLLLAAVYLRNLISIHVFLGLFALALFSLGNLLRALALGGAPPDGTLHALLLNVPATASWIWWSPYCWLVALLLWSAALPLGWAYWLVPGLSDRPASRYFPLVATAGFLAVSLGYLFWFPSEMGLLTSVGFEGGKWLFLLLYAPPVFALWFLGCTLVVAASGALRRKGMTATEWTTSMRNSLSRWLRAALVAAACLFAYALVDSLGQTFYAVAWSRGGKMAYLALVLPLFAALFRYASVFLDKLPLRKSVKIPVSWAAVGLSVLLGLAVMGLLSTVSHGFAWRWCTPEGNPALRLKWSAPAQVGPVVAQDDTDVLVRVRSSAPTMGEGQLGRSPMCAGALLILFGVLLALSFFMGQTPSFLNHSSHHSYYAAHLIRAWLGASNPERWKKDGRRLSVPVPGDDVSFGEYHPHLQGGPLHIINITFNETCSGKSQVEQRDRKGLSMALSPFGITVGREHHAIWCSIPRKPGSSVRASRKPPASALRGAWPKDGFMVFPSDIPNTRFLPLTLGYWAGISGAAFSTGMGSRTSAGLSFLLGLVNARLGYWWYSGVRPPSRTDATPPSLTERLESILTVVFPSQVHMLNEFLGRFHGPARIRWYLTDGGHLENTGCYELVRRRVPIILCMDNGADVGFTFGDIGELARKVRIDFGADLIFEPDRFKRKNLLRAFLAKDRRWKSLTRNDPDREAALLDAWSKGSLEDLRSRSAKAGARKGTCSDLQCSLAHAAAAFVYYRDQTQASRAGQFGPKCEVSHDGPPHAVILFVKSSITGDEPLDVLTYKKEHPDFPHESTADQFFDEAQWESYRKLGEHMAESIFVRGG